MCPPAPDPVPAPVVVLELALRVVALEGEGTEVRVTMHKRGGLDRLSADTALVEGDQVDPWRAEKCLEFREAEHRDRVAVRVRILDGPRDSGLVGHRREARGLQCEVRAHPHLVILGLSDGPPWEAVPVLRSSESPRARWPGSRTRERLTWRAHEQETHVPLLHLRGELIPQVIRRQVMRSSVPRRGRCIDNVDVPYCPALLCEGGS